MTREEYRLNRLKDILIAGLIIGIIIGSFIPVFDGEKFKNALAIIGAFAAVGSVARVIGWLER